MRESDTGLALARDNENEVRVLQKLVVSILFAWVLLASPAFAQADAAPPAAAATNAHALTPEEARRALDTLQDDTKRAQIIETLRAIADASPQPAPAAPVDKPSGIPLTADSLGAQLLLTVSEQVRDISSQIAEVARTLTHGGAAGSARAAVDAGAGAG